MFNNNFKNMLATRTKISTDGVDIITPHTDSDVRRGYQQFIYIPIPKRVQK